MSDWWNRTYLGSSERMAEIPDASIQCIVTSPPYYGLRDYGTGRWEGGDASCVHTRDKLGETSTLHAKAQFNGVEIYRETCGQCGAIRVDEQIGLEPTLGEFIDRLCAVFDECWRVLRDDGTMFVNMGDSYAGSYGAQGHRETPASLSRNSILNHPKRASGTGRMRMDGMKPKDLMLVPHRLAIALHARGWWLRDTIIWHKPNPMPSSVTDRCTPAHEYVFMFAKSENYFADMDAVREPLAAATLQRITQAKWLAGEQAGSTRANGGAKTNGPMRAVVNAKGSTRSPQFEDSPDSYNIEGANLRNVWTIATTPYTDAHFATFPRELPARCIRIGTSEAGCCSKCGASRRRLDEASGGTIGAGGWHDHADDLTVGHRSNADARGEGWETYRREMQGFRATCECNAPDRASTVLDPFGGSGTTAEVAESLGRRWVLYELNAEYLPLIAERTRQAGLFS